MSQWYCKLGGAPAGPFSRDELDYLFDRGQLTSDTEMRQQDERSWSRAAELLHDLFPPPPAPVAAAIESPQPAAEVPAAQPVVPQKPRPATKEETEAERRRKQVLLGTGIGAAAALLIFLLLLLLLTFGGFGKGSGFAGAGGQGAGDGTGTGSGTGPGSGSGTGGGAGSGTGGSAGSSKASSSDAKAGRAGGGNKSGAGADGAAQATAEAGDAQGATTGDAADPDLRARPQFAIQKFTAPAPAAGGAAAGSGDGSFLSGGGGGGGSDGSEFLGLKARGNKIVYIIDCSGSMAGQKLANAKQELIDSIKRLRPQQSAYVFFFASGSFPMFGPHDPVESKLLKCTPANVKKMEEWITDFNQSGGTQPRDSLIAALDLKPDVIFFLTDGGFASPADEVRTKNHASGRKVTSINTICFTDKSGEPVMQQIANENKGDYKFVP